MQILSIQILHVVYTTYNTDYVVYANLDSDISFIAVSVALYCFCTVPRGNILHLRRHASETVLHRATIIDARSSGTRERSACAEVSAEVHINYYTGACIPDDGLSKNPGEEKPATGGSLAENCLRIIAASRGVQVAQGRTRDSVSA